jgi:hypothetical protein
MNSQGVCREGLGGPRRLQGKVLYPFKLLLQLFRDPLMGFIDTLGIHGAKRVRATGLEDSVLGGILRLSVTKTKKYPCFNFRLKSNLINS